MHSIIKKTGLVTLTALVVAFISFTSVLAQSASTNPKSGSAGLSGVVPADPPSQGATISFPTSNQVFTEVPVDVTGVCPDGLLVKLFKNDVFAGSATCIGGAFTITTDLFSGANDLIARVFDDLDQPGPDSNTVSVTFNDANGLDAPSDPIIITSNFARRGANPGTVLGWPLAITGGTGPYAISVDWGDGEETLISLEQAGEFLGEHIYQTPGTYKVIVKATDSNGVTSFLQLVAISNGAVIEQSSRVDENGDIIPIGETTGANINGSAGGLKFITWPLYIMLFLIFSTFWLGRRYEIKKLKRKLASQQSLSG